MLPLFPVSNETDYQEHSLKPAFDGTNYLVPVVGCKPDGLCWVKAIFISKNGTKTNETLIKSFTYSDNTFVSEPKTAYSGNKYLVIWKEDNFGEEETSIKGRFVLPDGQLSGNELTIVSGIPIEESTTPDLAYGGGKYLVCYNKPFQYGNETHEAVYGKFVELNGTIGTEFKISSLWGKLDLNQIAFDGENFLVVYTEDGDGKKVLGRFVNPSSGPVGNEIVINDDDYYSDNPSAVIFDGEKYFVVYPNQDQSKPGVWHLYGKFVHTNGTVSEGDIPITTTHSHKLAPFIAFDGLKYLVTWMDGRNCGVDPSTENITCSRTGYDIYGRYIGKNGNLLGDEFLIYSSEANEVGGFFDKTVSGKALGLILKPFNLFPDAFPEFGDVYGSFWVSSGYEVFAPDKKEKVNAGSKYTIRWRAPAIAKKFDLYYSNDNKKTWNLIAQNVTTKIYRWSVPAQNGRKPNSFIKIVAKDDDGNTLKIFYSRPFSIEVARITIPSGGEILWSGEYIEIQWQTFGLNATVAKTVVQYSTNGGQTWNNIKTEIGNPGSVRWYIPSDINSPICRVRIIFKDSAGKNIAITETDAVFAIITLY